MHSKRYLNILLLIALFYLVIHVTLNSCNAKLKNDRVCWGSLDIQNVVHISFKAMYFVLMIGCITLRLAYYPPQ